MQESILKWSMSGNTKENWKVLNKSENLGVSGVNMGIEEEMKIIKKKEDSGNHLWKFPLKNWLKVLLSMICK